MTTSPSMLSTFRSTWSLMPSAYLLAVRGTPASGPQRVICRLGMGPSWEMEPHSSHFVLRGSLASGRLGPINLCEINSPMEPHSSHFVLRGSLASGRLGPINLYEINSPMEPHSSHFVLRGSPLGVKKVDSW